MQIEVFTNMGDLHIHYTRGLMSSSVILFLGVKMKIEDDVYTLHKVPHHTLSEEIKIKILGIKKNTVVII